MSGITFPSPKHLIEYAQEHKEIGTICFMTDGKIMNATINQDNRSRIREIFNMYVIETGRALEDDKHSFTLQVFLMNEQCMVGSGIWHVAKAKK